MKPNRISIKPSLEDVLCSLIHEQEDCAGTLSHLVWYFPRPDNQIALNAYESITGKTTANFIWLKLDKGILSSWINALEVLCADN